MFDGETDENNRKNTFCGSITDPFTSETHEVYVRFFAEVQGLESKVKTTLHDNNNCCRAKENDAYEFIMIHKSVPCHRHHFREDDT